MQKPKHSRQPHNLYYFPIAKTRLKIFLITSNGITVNARSVTSRITSAGSACARNISPPKNTSKICTRDTVSMIKRKPLFLRIFAKKRIRLVLALNALKIPQKTNSVKNAVINPTKSLSKPYLTRMDGKVRKTESKATVYAPVMRI